MPLLQPLLKGGYLAKFSNIHWFFKELPTLKSGFLILGSPVRVSAEPPVIPANYLFLSLTFVHLGKILGNILK